MDNDKITETMLKMVSDNRYHSMVANYILEKYNPNMDYVEVKKIAILLIEKHKFPYSTILAGKVDQIIKEYLIERNLYKESVKQKNEQKKEVPLKTKKKKINKKGVVLALVAIFAVSNLAAVIQNNIEEYKYDQEISQALGMYVADKNSYDYMEKLSIVSQNTERVPDVLDDNGYPIHETSNYGIAMDILEICKADPNLFDMCMYDNYFRMNSNQDYNMDIVLKVLKGYTENDLDMLSIYKKIENCDVFLEYIVLSGFSNPNSKDHFRLLEDIETYKILKQEDGDALSKLNKESLERIEKLKKNYKQSGKNLYKEYKDEIQNLGGENFGTR